MCYTFIDEIANCGKKLLDQSPTNLRCESTLFGDEIKKLSSFSKFQDNHVLCLNWFVLEFDLCIQLMINHIDQIFEVKIGQEIYLDFKSFLFG
jgi:hypothetical protein